MRKSVHDMMLRHPACREVALNIVSSFSIACAPKARKTLVDPQRNKEDNPGPTDETYRLPPDTSKKPEEEVRKPTSRVVWGQTA